MTNAQLTGALFVLYCLAVSAQAAPLVPVDQEITQAEVLALVDARHPELKAFAAAIVAKDAPAAQQALIEHFARRTTPVLPPASFPGIGEGNSMAVLGKASPEQAAKWLGHTFTLSNNDIGKQETYDLGPQIQWLKNPSEALSWILYLNQLNYLNSLAGLYCETHDEKLAAEIGQCLLSWSQQAPRGYGYTNKGEIIKSGMEVRNRLCNLLATYDVVRTSPALTPQMHLAFWKVFIASARELQTYEGVSFPGLIPLAVMYPEFTESREWLKSGEANLRHCLISRTSPEGAWDTESISYQTVCVPWAARTLEFLQANPASGDFSAMAAMVKSQMEKLLGLMLWIAMPNGGSPNVGDTYGRTDWNDGFTRSMLRSYIHTQMTPEQQAKLNMIPDTYTRLKATLALAHSPWEGLPAPIGTTEPARASYAFPGSGYYVMRSSWEPRQARYLYFDLTPQALGHAHNDAGHFELYAYGKPLLADTGDYFLGWGYRAALHNTIEVDGQDQARGAAATMLPHEWLSTNGFDFADLAHEAYGAQKINHRRKLLFIKPDYYVLCDILTGEGDHKYEQFFHFAGANQGTASTASLDEKTLTAASTNDDMANVQIIPAHTEGLKAAFVAAQDTAMKTDDKFDRSAMLGWMVTGGTFQRVKAPVVAYERQGAAPQAFYDVLYPTPASAEAKISVQTLPVTAAGEPVPPTEAAGLVVTGTVTRPRHDPEQIKLNLGDNLALGKPGFAEINQTTITPTTALFTDGDHSAHVVGGAVGSSPYTPGVLLKGRFSVDFGQEVDVNHVILAHGTWNGSGIIYPPQKLTVQYWDGANWLDVAAAQTRWQEGEVTHTSFRPVRTTRLSVAVERAAGGRLALREFEAYRVAETELQRVAALRAEKTTDRFTDTILISHNGPALRKYGDYSFDGEIALIRRDAQGKVTQVCFKDATRLEDARGLRLSAASPQPYCNITLSGVTGTVECLAGGTVQLTANGAPIKLDGVAEAAAQRPQIIDAKVILEPAQPGFAGAQPSALITWRTNVPTTTQVLFGEEGRFDRRTILDPRLTTEHQAHAYFLKPNQQYTFRIQSRAHGDAIETLDLKGN
ncbi:MAG: heparinase II/III domain-containing protein [Armatimonadota bacterium]